VVKMKKAILALLIAVLGGGVGACTSGDVDQSTFESQLIEAAELEEAEAACVANRTYAEFEPSEINDIYTAVDVEDLDDRLETAFEGYVTECTAQPG